jgi:heptosyltransferase I
MIISKSPRQYRILPVPTKAQVPPIGAVELNHHSRFNPLQLPVPRVLLVKLSSLGDVIHNLPVASDLARLLPGIEIEWAVESPYAPLVALHPDVRRVWPISLRAVKKSKLDIGSWKRVLDQRKALRTAGADWTLDTQGLLKSAWIAKGAGLPTYGYDKESIREPLAARLYDHSFAVSKTIHAVERNRLLAALATKQSDKNVNRGTLDYGLTRYNAPIHTAKQSDWLHDLRTRGPYWVFLSATSRAEKMWSAEHWASLAAVAQRRGIQTVWPGGSEREIAYARELENQTPNPALSLVPPQMSLVDAAQLLLHAQAVVGVDTGLTHLAVALERPTVGLYVATKPGLTGLYCRGIGMGATAQNLGGIGQMPDTNAVLDEIDVLLHLRAEANTQID